MAAAKQTKAPGRQDSIRRILESLEKRYRADFRVPEEQPVLETLIYAICLEDCTFAEAETYYQRIGTLFHDFNEARVSSITELSQVFVKSPFAEWKAFRFRHLLTHVFESFYEFNFESLLRKSNEHANRLLGRIPELSQFARNYTMRHCVGINLLPLDDRMRDALAWLGLGTAGQTPQRTASALKSIVRKNEADRFCGLVRCLANDPLLIRVLDSEKEEDPRPVHEVTTAVERLEILFTETARRKRKSTAGGKTAAKKTAKKTAAKKTAKKT
ncbi:MAG TPA: hypothetical protein DCE43_10750, partial [Planctomycetaceae bacterium]|nr:hypothetical protein [Planctomycetaceae bacterium]